MFAENMQRLGVEGETPPSRGGIGSSDIGNVSMTVPTIHPYLKIVDGDVSGHTPEFREASGSGRGYNAMLLAAKGLAMTALDVMYRPGVVDEMWSAWRASVKGEACPPDSGSRPTSGPPRFAGNARRSVRPV